MERFSSKLKPFCRVSLARATGSQLSCDGPIHLNASLVPHSLAYGVNGSMVDVRTWRVASIGPPPLEHVNVFTERLANKGVVVHDRFTPESGRERRNYEQDFQTRSDRSSVWSVLTGRPARWSDGEGAHGYSWRTAASHAETRHGVQAGGPHQTLRAKIR